MSNFVSCPTQITMDPVTILLGGALFIIALLFLLTGEKKEAEVARRVNKLPGPTRYPIFGTDLPLLFVKRKGK
jgi:hypothetical protein